MAAVDHRSFIHDLLLPWYHTAGQAGGLKQRWVGVVVGAWGWGGGGSYSHMGGRGSIWWQRRRKRINKKQIKENIRTEEKREHDQ